MLHSWLRQWVKKFFGTSRKTQRPAQRRRPVALRLEPLEDRQLLSVAPTQAILQDLTASFLLDM